MLSRMKMVTPSPVSVMQCSPCVLCRSRCKEKLLILLMSDGAIACRWPSSYSGRWRSFMMRRSNSPRCRSSSGALAPSASARCLSVRTKFHTASVKNPYHLICTCMLELRAQDAPGKDGIDPCAITGCTMFWKRCSLPAHYTP